MPMSSAGRPREMPGSTSGSSASGGGTGSSGATTDVSATAGLRGPRVLRLAQIGDVRRSLRREGLALGEGEVIRAAGRLELAVEARRVAAEPDGLVVDHDLA